MDEYIPLAPHAIDITGQRFGRLVVLGPVERNKHKQVIWRCQCDCGAETVVAGYHLRYGDTVSCGCARTDATRDTKTTHGLGGDRLYSVWSNIKSRCYNTSARDFQHYGGRGISMCDEWRDDVRAFYDYVTALPRYNEPGMTLDRIDNDSHYEPGNVRWATRREQNFNRRDRESSAMIEFRGKRLNVAAWARELGINRSTLWGRIRSGWPIERALTKGR